MSNKEGLDKYLHNLPRNTQGGSSSTLRGPRAPAKPAKWRSAASNDAKDPRDDLVYPKQKKLGINDGIRDQVGRLQEATGTVVSAAKAVTAAPARPAPPPKPAISRKPSTPPLVTKPQTAVVAFEASLDPRRRPHPPRPPPQTPPKPSSPVNLQQRTAIPSYSSSSSTSSDAAQHPSSPRPDSPSSPQQSSPRVAASSSSTSSPNERVSVPNPLYAGVSCAGCGKPISGRVIRVDHNQWHVDCFKCKHCGQDLEHVAFYSKDGQPYCALDYHELFSTRCDYCDTPIEEKSINALGKHYHMGHFFCRGCSKPFGESDAFMVHDGHAYCEKDYMAKFGHKCMGCGEYITGEFIGALGGDWHKECFVCADCGKAFESATFYVRNNRPFCHLHFKAGGKVCYRCNEVIDGRGATAFGKDYHTHHFQCARCSKLLSSRVPGMWQEGAPGELVCKLCARTQS